MFITEAVYDMKFSHWCVLTGALFLVQVVSWSLQEQLLQKLEYTRVCYNQIVDNAVEDGLLAGVTDTYGIADVDCNVAVEAFKESLLNGFDVTKDSVSGKKILDKIRCLVILKNQYFIVITPKEQQLHEYESLYNEWNIRFTLDGQVQCQKEGHSEKYVGTELQIRQKIGYNPEVSQSNWKNEAITDSIEKQVELAINQDGYKDADYHIDIPSVEEVSTHTIWGLGMLCFMKYDTYIFNDMKYDRYTLSVAQIKEN